MIFLLFFNLLLSNFAHAQDQRLCDYFGWDCSNSYTGGRKSSQSLPSQAAASNLNPANIKYLKGFGVETMWHPNNPLIFSLASGTGNMGGALITKSFENSFFGNRVIEIDDNLHNRHLFNQHYNNNKFNAAGGIKLFDHQFLGLDLGGSVKFNQDTNRASLGVGMSGRLGPLNFGASFYNDDVNVVLDNYKSPYTGQTYSKFYNSATYQEKFKVETYSIGSKLRKLTFDVGVIKTSYDFYTENTRIFIYSSSYSYKKIILNGAIRKEYSPQQRYSHGVMITQRRKDFNYYGIQYNPNKRFTMTAHYNYFLLNELSFSASVFF